MKRASVLVVTICLTTLVGAQDPPVLVSPEVRLDRTVVFRLWAPRAGDVQLTGNWMGPQPPDIKTFAEKRTESVAAQVAGKSKGYAPQQFGFGPDPQPHRPDRDVGGRVVIADALRLRGLRLRVDQRPGTAIWWAVYVQPSSSSAWHCAATARASASVITVWLYIVRSSCVWAVLPGVRPRARPCGG